MAGTFERTIGFKTATALVVGSIIGSGIFIRPAEMAGLLGSPWHIIGAWSVAGLFTMLSILVLAEVAAMFPEDGGQYAFMRHMYGDFWAYLFGWSAFAAINCAGTAGIAFIAAEYLTYFFPIPSFPPETEAAITVHIPMIGELRPLENFGVKMICILFLTIFSVISYRSTKASGRIQFVFAAAKVIAIIFLVFGIFFSGKGDVSKMFEPSALIHPTGFALVVAFVAACNGALQALDGCSAMLNLTGEIKDPGKTIPRSLIAGIFTCIFIYIIINLSMFYVLGVDEMAVSRLVASDAVKVALGFTGGGIVAFLICFSVLGSTQVNVLSPPRLTFAMARDGNFFRTAGRVHPRFNTPGNAIIIHLVVMVIMVLSGSFFILADLYIFVVWLFNLMMMAGLFILRKKYPDKERPFKTPGYPLLPALVILFNLFYLILTIYHDVERYFEGRSRVMHSVFGLVIVAVGIPLYFYFKRKREAVSGRGLRNEPDISDSTDG